MTVSLSTFLQHTSIAGLATILVLLACSVYIAALGRDLHLRSRAVALDGDWLLAQLRYLLFGAKVSPEKAQAFLAGHDQPLARILRELLFLQPPTLERGDYLLSSQLDRERSRLEAGLSSLGTVAVIAPFVGLFGTVVGITKTFADVAKMGKAGIEVVSAGVSEALVATAIGLLVAIVSVVMFNAFKARFDRLTSQWDVSGRAFLSLLTSSPEEAARLLDSTLSQQPLASAEEFVGKNPSPA
jgi:biopolymer transport protein ExbB/TolQ